MKGQEGKGRRTVQERKEEGMGRRERKSKRAEKESRGHGHERN